MDPRGLVVGPGQMALLHRPRPALQDLRAQETADRQQDPDRVRMPKMRIQLGEEISSQDNKSPTSDDTGEGSFLTI